MTGQDLKEFVEEGLDTGSINDTWFYNALNIAKTVLEEERDWKILETEDSSLTANVGDTFLTVKNLPTRFSSMIQVFLTYGNNNPEFYRPIPFAKRYAYKDSMNRYYIDLKSGKIAFCGTVSTSKTVHLVYKEYSADIDANSSWEFPDRFHPILGFMVATMFRGGVDYDRVNAQNLIQNNTDAKALYGALVMWDDTLRQKELDGSYEPQQSFDADGFGMGENDGFNLGNF